MSKQPRNDVELPRDHTRNKERDDSATPQKYCAMSPTQLDCFETKNCNRPVLLLSSLCSFRIGVLLRWLRTVYNLCLVGVC